MARGRGKCRLESFRRINPQPPKTQTQILTLRSALPRVTFHACCELRQQFLVHHVDVVDVGEEFEHLTLAENGGGGGGVAEWANKNLKESENRGEGNFFHIRQRLHVINFGR